jgi:DNA sulfur modification protein DndD
VEIKRIRLRDFRQFRGDQFVEFATEGDQNVTLIHAENGVGKTTLLNAILWTFYEATTSKFEQKDRIINFDAERAGARSASVEVHFSHEDNDYVAERIHKVTDGGHAKPSFKVMRIAKNGAFEAPLPNPVAFINSVIPAAMAPYFFFDGEQAETFSAEMNRKEIAKAIRNILGSTLIETAIADLDYLSKKFNEEIGENSDDAEINAVERSLSNLEQQRDKRTGRIADLEIEIDGLTHQLSEITAKLSEAREAAQHQHAREDKQHQLKGIEDQLKETHLEILKWISSKAMVSVSSKLTSLSLDFIDEQSLKGRIPSPYNEDFVKGLLNAERCICDRPLMPATGEWRAVTSLLSTASNAEVLGRVIRARTRIGVLKEQRQDAPTLLAAAEEKLVRLSDQRNRLEREIEDIGRRIADLPVAEIQERERARKDIEKTLEARKTERIRTQRDNEVDQAEINRLNRELADLALKNVATRGLVVRRNLATRGSELLQALLKVNEESARKDIEAAVNKVLEMTTRRYYRFEVDESFQIRLLYADGTLTPKSGGENQMMSLAFLAALIEYAKKRSASDDDDRLFIPATVAPLILDSPFGQLDNSYRESTAKFVPSMAPQVVLLVSSSQGKEQVYNAIQDRIGKEYVLIAHNKQEKGQKGEDILTIGGLDIATTLFGQESDMTEIREVRV